MIVTITKSAYISAQGLFVRMIDETLAEIQVGSDLVHGKLLSKSPKQDQGAT